MFNEKTWRDGEQLVQEHLKKNDYKIVYTNLDVVGVELDVVSVLSVSKQKRKLKLEFKQKIKNEETKQGKIVLKQTLKNLISELKPVLVITEVKARSTDEFGKGYESVGKMKQTHIKRGAKALLKKPEFEGFDVRFDVASVDGGVISYIESAF